MRVIYDDIRVTSHKVESFSFTNRQLSYGVDYRGKYSNGTLTSNGSYSEFTGFINFPYSIPLSEYNVVTVWATIQDNLSPSVSVLGHDAGKLVSGVSVPLTFNGNVFSNRSTISSLAIEVSGAIVVAGITIDKVEFSKQKPFGEVPRLKANVDNNVMLGNGIKQSQYPMLESYYIEGRLSLKGVPVPGTLMRIQVDSANNLIIPTQPNGKYLHYTTAAIPITLVAYSQWYNHNSMIRANVRPNKDIRTSIGSFVYSI